MPKKSPLPWWERVRERGKVAEISHVNLFTLPPDLLPSREEECFQSLLHEGQFYQNTFMNPMFSY